MKQMRFMRRSSAGVADDVSSTLLLLKRKRTVVVTTTYASPVWAIVPASLNTSLPAHRVESCYTGSGFRSDNGLQRKSRCCTCNADQQVRLLASTWVGKAPCRSILRVGLKPREAATSFANTCAPCP